MTAPLFMTAGLILLVPAVLMGAALSVLSGFHAAQRDGLGWEIGRLYSVDTWGAVPL
jgi:hypothetical protein